jgi:hypothetical protein
MKKKKFENFILTKMRSFEEIQLDELQEKIIQERNDSIV